MSSDVFLPSQQTALQINIAKKYPEVPPYSPHELFPEYPFSHLSEKENPVYPAVRELFLSLGYDKENFGLRSWNPLGRFVAPGQKVVVKPNWVLHRSHGRGTSDGLITHPSVIRVIIDYLVIALKGEGVIIVGDAPIQSADFYAIVKQGHLESMKSMVESNTSIFIDIKDFRREITKRDSFGKVVGHYWQDDKKFIVVNLKDDSFLTPIAHDFRRYRVTNYDKNKMLNYHNETDHKYVIYEDVLKADAVILLPKLKSHRKAGLTCCLKNSVGINCQKDCLPHHRKNSLAEGGDAYGDACFLKRCKENIYEGFDQTKSRLKQSIYYFLLRIIERILRTYAVDDVFEGNWYGNDTVWRTILDINRILFFADCDGVLHSTAKRKIFYLVDGIVAGEGEGPLEPEDRPLGLMLAGENPLAVDLLAARVAGFDYRLIPVLASAVKNSFLWPEGMLVDDLLVRICGRQLYINEVDLNYNIKPSSGWEGHIERVGMLERE